MKTTGTKAIEAGLEWPLRPVLTSLNGDNSWLFSFPRPDHDGHHQYFYHVAFEPWLAGPTTQLSGWIVHITLGQQAVVADGDAVQAVAAEIEQIAAGLAKASGSGSTRPAQDKSGDGYHGPVDAIVVLTDFIDHCHRPTLETFDRRIPLVGSKEVAAKVRPWGHFDSISTLPELDPAWTTWQAQHDATADNAWPLPPWLTVLKMRGETFLNFAGAIVWSHALASGEVVHEAILDAPHGVEAISGEGSDVEAFLGMAPATTPLALLHGLKESFSTSWWRTTHGAEAGLRLYRAAGSRYWVRSHDSDLEYRGLLLRATVLDVRRTLEWALGREQDASPAKDVDFVDVGNGNSFVLA